MLTHALTASLSLSPLLLQGDLIWYDAGGTGEFDLPIGARVKQADSGQIIIVTDDDEVRTASRASADRRARVWLVLASIWPQQWW